MSAEVELRMLEGSEFQTVGAAMLKLREAKVVLFSVSLLCKWREYLLVKFCISKHVFFYASVGLLCTTILSVSSFCM